jgi:hypothetical protein
MSYKKSNILSNSEFYYKDHQVQLPKDYLIPLSHEYEKKLEVPHQIPLKKFRNAASVKEIKLINGPSAFELAEEEEQKLKENLKNKKEELDRKANLIHNIVIEREKEIKENEEREKKQLEQTLIVIIKDALKFSKENPPLLSMMPNSLTNAINQLKEERGIKKRTSNILNVSSGSLNLSFNTNASMGSVKKYESNQFLKLLGLDLANLSPENIRIDINKAYEFIKKWKVSNKNEIKKIIRFKVVNEIMNVEERRSVQKLAKINKKVKELMDKKKQAELVEKKKKEDFIVFSQSMSETNVNTNVNTTKENRTTLKQENDNKVRNTETRKINNTLYSQNNTREKSNEPIKITSTLNTLNNVNSLPNNTVTNNNHQPLRVVTEVSKANTEIKSNSKKKSISKRHDYANQVLQKNDDKKKKSKILYNSYKNAERIIRHIDNNESLKTNENLVRHFQTFKYTKKFDEVTNSILKTQQITVCSEADYGNINLVNTENENGYSSNQI